MSRIFGNRKSYLLDHTMDDVPLKDLKERSLGRSTIPTISGKDGPPSYQATVGRFVETASQRRDRHRSHLVVYCIMFVMAIGMSSILGMWPYLHEELVPSTTKKSLGWVVAVNPLGQMLAAPALGLWANKTGSIRAVSITSVVMFMVGNIMYALLAVFKNTGEMGPYYAMMVSRFILGVSSALSSVCRTYMASSTTLEERTFSLSMLSVGQATGVIIGPILQAVLTLTIPDNLDTGVEWFQWNKYTAPAWISAVLAVINLVILLPCVFQEHNISKNEKDFMTSSNGPENQVKLPSPDYRPIAGILYARFAITFIAVLMEAILIPLVMDQYAWSENRAMVGMAIAVSVAGVLNIIMYFLSGVLSRKFDERLLALLLGLLPMMVGLFLFIPWGHGVIPMQHCDQVNVTDAVPSTTQTVQMQQLSQYQAGMLADDADDDEHCSEGCPPIQEWCYNTPQLPGIQLIIAFIIAIVGFPVAQGILLGIFSKILGPRPQGLWMGVVGTAGSISRIIGPIIVTYIYEEFGTRWCFGILSLINAVALVELALLYRRLIPMKLPNREINAYDGPASPEHSS
ncbi:major facilitator superfamily domain-containing protein 8 isoform X1 [Cherax quadricarinatus]